MEIIISNVIHYLAEMKVELSVTVIFGMIFLFVASIKWLNWATFETLPALCGIVEFCYFTVLRSEEILNVFFIYIRKGHVFTSFDRKITFRLSSDKI